MRILMVHNRYQQEGGEDGVVRAEASLLHQNGHEVEFFEENNDSIVGRIDALTTATRCVYSVAAASEIRKRLSEFRPDLVHIHNFFPRLSPSVHYVCRRMHVPVVQTLHNYRLLCPASTLLRDGSICEECVGKVLSWPAVRYGCYRQSRIASAAVANMLFIHRLCATWARNVNRFIALTEFARQKFCAGGLPINKVVVKPNFVLDDPGIGEGNGGYALFVGRLSEEKGLETLLNVWAQLKTKRLLKLVGDGPLASKVRDIVSTIPSIEWLGRHKKQEVYRLMADAAVLIFPSIWYEGFPLVLAEAFATGLPVIASRLGAMAEIVSDGKTGRLFTPGKVEELAEAVEWAFADRDRLHAMRSSVRNEFECKYTAKSNYALLLDIYRSACDDSLSARVKSVHAARIGSDLRSRHHQNRNPWGKGY
jgi:glycosyltransferase involved in cell wall biosynthesis